MRHVGAQHQSGGGRRADRRYDSALALGSFIAVLSLGLGFVALPQQSAVADDSVEPASTVLESVQSGQGAASPGQSRSVDTGAEGSSASDQSGDGVGAVEAAQSEEGSSSASSQAGEEERPIPLLQPRSSHSSLAAAPFGLRDSLSCEAGDYYTISNEGQVYKVSSAGGVPDPRTTFAWDFSQKSDKSKHYNGLAIGAEGETAYAFNRKAGKSGDRLGIVRWNSGGGVPKQVYLGHLPKIEGLVDYKGNSVSGVALGNMVAGGVSPTDPDGEFYFGGFFYFKPYDKASGNYTYFHLLKYSPSTGNVSTVGYVNIRKDKASQNNGDIAFSAAGDLFILWNDGKGRTKIVPVLRRDLQDAAGGEIYASGETSEQDTDQGQYNGLAFDAEGNLFVQYSDGGTFNYSIDPDTGREIEGSLTQLENIAKGNGSDLASCANPSTLFLVKDLVARENPRTSSRSQ